MPEAMEAVRTADDIRDFTQSQRTADIARSMTYDHRAMPDAPQNATPDLAAVVRARLRS